MGRVFRLWVAIAVAVGHAPGPAVADDRMASDCYASEPPMTVRKPAPQAPGGFAFPARIAANPSEGGDRGSSAPQSSAPQSSAASRSDDTPQSATAIDDLRRRAAGWSDDVARQAGEATRNAVRSVLPGDPRETIRGDQAVVATPGRDDPRATAGGPASGFATGGALVADPVGTRANGPSTAPSSGSQSPWYTHADAAGRPAAARPAPTPTADESGPFRGQSEAQNFRGDSVTAVPSRFTQSAAAGEDAPLYDNRDPRLSQDARLSQDPRAFQDARDFQDARTFQDARAFQDPRIVQDPRAFQDRSESQPPRRFDGREDFLDAYDGRAATAGGAPATSVAAPAARPNLSPRYAEDSNADPRWGVTSTFGRMPQGLSRPPEAAPAGAYADGYVDRDGGSASSPPRGRVALAERSADGSRSAFDVDERSPRDDGVSTVRAVAERDDTAAAPRRRESLRDQNPIASRDPAAIGIDERVDRKRAVKTVAAQPVFNGLLLFSFVANIYLVVWLKNLRHEFREMVAAKRAARSSA